MNENESLLTNELQIPRGAVDSIACFRLTTPKLSVGHAERIAKWLYIEGGYVTAYRGDSFWAISTKLEDSVPSATEIVQKQLSQNVTIAMSIVQFCNAEFHVREALLFEILKLYGHQKGYFHAFGRILFRIDNVTQSTLYPAFSVSIQERPGYYALYIDPLVLSLGHVSEWFDPLVLGERVIRLCKYSSSCPYLLEQSRCSYAFPQFLGYVSAKRQKDAVTSADREVLQKRFSHCPFISSENIQLVSIRRTQRASKYLDYPDFLLLRCLTRAERAKIDAQKVFGGRNLPNAASRFKQTQGIINRLFANNRVSLSDLSVEIVNKLDDASAKPPAGSALFLTEPNLVFDPRSTPPHATEPSLLFYHGVYDAYSNQRPFRCISPYLLLPDGDGVKEKVQGFLGKLANGIEHVDVNTGSLKVDVAGLNHRFSKFNCRFELPSQEDIYVAEAVRRFEERANTIVNKWSKDRDPNRMVLVFLPPGISVGGEYEEDVTEIDKLLDYRKASSLYYRLKRIFVEAGIPCQMIDLDTLEKVDRFTLQSILVNMYVKMGGRPWTLERKIGDADMFIGIGFGLSPKGAPQNVYVGIANVFDDHGEWLDITSDYKQISAAERESFYEWDAFTPISASYKLTMDLAEKIVRDSLRIYSDLSGVQRHPCNIAIHKNGPVHECEVEGFLKPIGETVQEGNNIEKLGILSIIKNHGIRLYGSEDQDRRFNRVPLRGGIRFLNKDEAVLCATGKFEAWRRGRSEMAYSGIGTPCPVLLKQHCVGNEMIDRYSLQQVDEYGLEELAEQAFALTKLHWGSLRTDIRLPITSLYSQRVAAVIAKAGITNIERQLALRRPWFL